MNIDALIKKLLEKLTGRARRTNKVNDTIEKIIGEVGKIFVRTEKLLEIAIKQSQSNELENNPRISAEEVQTTLQNQYRSLKSLKEIGKFISLLQLFNKIISQYHDVISELIKTQDSLKGVLKLLIGEAEGIVNDCIDDLESLSDDTSSTATESGMYELNTTCSAFPGNSSRWLLWDKFGTFRENTDEKLQENGWRKLGDDCYLSHTDDMDVLKKDILLLRPCDFFECYQVIGYINPINIRSANLLVDQNIPEAYYKKLVTYSDHSQQQLVYNALDGQKSAQEKLSETLRKEGYTIDPTKWEGKRLKK
jgi:hypothetical protein